MSRLNVAQILKNQGLLTTLWVDNNTDVLPQDQDGSITRPYSLMQKAMNHISGAEPGQFGAPGSLYGWIITVNPGIYVDPFTVPPDRAITIEGPIRSTIIGNCTWITQNNFTCLLTFRNIGIGSLIIQDGDNAATLANLALENVSIQGITQTGNSVVDVSFAGISNASAEFSNGQGAACVCTADVIVNGLVIGANTAFLPTCTIISASQINFENCVIQQNIFSVSDTIFEGCTWLGSNNITITGRYGTTTMDDGSSASFLGNSGNVINSKFLLSVQKDTGWAFGGNVNRSAGLNINVSDGYGYIFIGNNTTALINWPTTSMTLPSNQILDVYATIHNAVTFGPNPVDINNGHLLATLYTNDTDVIFLSKNIIENIQTAPNTDTYLKSTIGIASGNGIMASINLSSSLQIDMDGGYFFTGLLKHTVPDDTAISFRYWYRDGYGGWLSIPLQYTINVDGYDDGTGTLAQLSSGQWKKDLLFVSTSDDGVEYHIVYGQQVFVSSSLAEGGSLPDSPDVLIKCALKCAGIVVEGSSTSINNITDERLVIGQASGTTVTINGLTTQQHQTLRQLIHFIDDGPADGFASGAYKEITPRGAVFPTNIIWYTDSTRSKKIVEQLIQWSGIVPITITWNVYNIDGVSVAHTVQDTISYVDNICESSRTRSIN